MAMVETLGHLIRGRAREGAGATAVPTDGDGSSSSGTGPNDGEDAQTRSLLDALEERLRDSHAFVRMRVLQTYLTLIECVPTYTCLRRPLCVCEQRLTRA
jgi:hypothetical protein